MHHGSPPIVFLGCPWSVYWLVHPANLVSCNAHSHVGSLTHLPYRVEIFLRKCVHHQSACSRVFCGDIVEISLCVVWVRWVIPPFPGVSVNLMNCVDLAVLTRMKHAHGLATVDFEVLVWFIGHYNMKHTWACNDIIHSYQSFICITVWILRPVFEWRFKHNSCQCRVSLLPWVTCISYTHWSKVVAP